MKIHKKSLITIILIVSSLIALIGLFTFLKPQEPIKLSEGYSSPRGGSVDRIEDIPGVKDVQRFSDVRKNSVPISNESRNTSGQSRLSRPVPTPTPLPYPRIAINYSIQRTALIRNESAGINSTFIIVTLDIRNYGYIYFDAHPTKFKIVGQDMGQDIELKPSVNINTGDMLDNIVPNNSRTKGDLIFKVDRKTTTFAPKIIYLNNSYQILYMQVSQSVMEDRKKEKKDKNEGHYDRYKN